MEIEYDQDIMVVTLPMRLDAGRLLAVQDDFAQAVAAHGGQVVVDLSRVTFTASMALRMLLMNLKSIQPTGGDLRLAALQPQVADIFHKSRFDTLFKIYATRAAAIASYRGEHDSTR